MTTVVRRWLRPLRVRLNRGSGAPAPGAGREAAAWQLVDPMTLAGDLDAIVAAPAEAVRTWITRDAMPAMYLYRVDPQANPVLRRRAGELLAGRFRAHTTVAVRREHLPPRWTRQPGSSRTEEMYRHALTWLEPLITVAHQQDDDDMWDVIVDVITSWIVVNSDARPPAARSEGTAAGRSPGAWHDHAVSLRMRLLCWFLELYRRRPAVEEAVVRLVVASVYQHGLFLADDTTYGHRSNHALEAAGSLLSVCIVFPELRVARMWSNLAVRRLEAYVDQAFAADGFSREQSPRYHFFILRRLAALVSYLTSVDHPVPSGVRRRLDQASEVWPWLLRPDGSLPRIGDSNERAIPHWRRSLEEIGGAPPPASPSSHTNPRSDGAALLAGTGGIYAVLRGQHPDDIAVTDDTHVVFKTDYFRYPHFHHDGLSFVLYALGREWLIDPGRHSYEYDRWERQYLCSSTAHNVVEVGSRFDVHPVELTAVRRTSDGDRVTARHHLPHAVHTRTLEHRPPRQIRVRDDIDVTDGRRRTIRQLFHVHPDCEVEIEGDRAVRLLAPSGDSCVITQRFAGGWRVVRGQRHPEAVGWYSPRALVIEPISTCVYELESADRVRFETRIDVVPALRGADQRAPSAALERRIRSA